MIALRCWAQYGSDGAFCERAHEPDMVHIHIGNSPKYDSDVSWYDEHCEQDARPNGRKSAALRILEISHEADRLAFVERTPSEWPAILRAIAARLHADTSAASADFADIRGEIEQGRRILEGSPVVVSPNIRFMQVTMAHLALVADILQAQCAVLRPGPFTAPIEKGCCNGQ